MDSRRYYELIGKAMMEEDDSVDGKPMPLAMRAAVRGTMVSSRDI